MFSVIITAFASNKNRFLAHGKGWKKESIHRIDVSNTELVKQAFRRRICSYIVDNSLHYIKNRDARGNGGGGAFHNSNIRNFMVYEDRLETNLLQLFAHPEKS